MLSIKFLKFLKKESIYLYNFDQTLSPFKTYLKGHIGAMPIKGLQGPKRKAVIKKFLHFLVVHPAPSHKMDLKLNRLTSPPPPLTHKSEIIA